jgi:uncharacterized cofD-like protein
MANTKINKRLNIVCLGGGIGTSVLIAGLKKFNHKITVITSMADDGGSSGRLRKGYNIMPPGDMVSCIAALVEDENKELASLLTYRFPGNSKENKIIDGHKLGNLIMLAEILRTKDIYKALDATKKMFRVTADILPASDERTQLSAITNDGRRIHSETALDVARYAEPHGLKKIYITPKSPKVNPKVIQSLKEADVIISGPGDLYTNQLPVLVIPQIKKIVLSSKAKKIFVLNIANKPFETKGFSLNDFITAIESHLDKFPFTTIVANNNFSYSIPSEHKKYKFIALNDVLKNKNITLIQGDLVRKEFPVYHDSTKLAKVIVENI